MAWYRHTMAITEINKSQQTVKIIFNLNLIVLIWFMLKLSKMLSGYCVLWQAVPLSLADASRAVLLYDFFHKSMVKNKTKENCIENQNCKLVFTLRYAGKADCPTLYLVWSKFGMLNISAGRRVSYLSKRPQETWLKCSRYLQQFLTAHWELLNGLIQQCLS